MALDPNRWTLKTQEAVQRGPRAGPPDQQPRGHPRPPPRSPCWARRRASSCPSLQKVGVHPLPLRNAADEALAKLPKAYGGEARIEPRAHRGAGRGRRRRAVELARRVPLHRAPAAGPGRPGRRRPRRSCWAPWPRCAAATGSPARTPRTSTRRSRSTAATSPRRPARASSTPSSAATRRSAASSRCCRRRTKNNPVLIGEPGVGKTAIVEGLARRIVEGDVPEGLQQQAAHRARPGGRWWPAPSTAASSRSGSRPSSRRSPTPTARSSPSSTSCTPSSAPARRRGRDGRRQHDQADAGPRRAAHDRRHHARRVPQVHREGRRPRAPLPAGVRRRASSRTPSPSSAASRSATRCTTACASRTPRSWRAAVLSDRYLTGRFLPDKAIDLVDEAASQAAHRDRLDAHRDRRRRAPHPPARDRAGRAGQGDRRRVEGAPRRPRRGAGRPQGAGRRR